ncbi:phosphoenolpyruvate carboxylase [Candidatus Woesearchaeota archaeon]|nr:phosphoenolpyruvate carboxylase [Candidatus Woesearchaeota archaeon]
MSTQHPDNVSQPFFSNNSVLEGDDEIKEAFYAFSHLGCNEQLWDCEGKEVDNFVVQKILSKYPEYFLKHKLGRDKVLTLRLPNPSVQKIDAKILLEALHSIPRNFDINKMFYNEDISPIQEIYIPMVTNAKEVIRVSEYYKQHVIAAQHSSLVKDDITISQWLGKSMPENIRVTPLVETADGMLAVDKIVREIIQTEKAQDYQRIWLARSDPALNYGSLSAVLLNKISLSKLHNLQEELSIDILPILGCGGAPFRGNLTPQNTSSIIRGYPSVHTFTMQSSFKYDHPIEEVKQAVDLINESKRKAPIAIDEQRCLQILNKFTKHYQEMLPLLAPFVNKVSSFVPKRRKRSLHIGLFGYSRASAGITLPRAITFCASLYSLGLPPEVIGMDCLTEDDKEYLRSIYPAFDYDFSQALRYMNLDNLSNFPKEVNDAVLHAIKHTNYDTDEKHKKITSQIMDSISHEKTSVLTEKIIEAGFVRGFLG